MMAQGASGDCWSGVQTALELLTIGNKAKNGPKTANYCMRIQLIEKPLYAYTECPDMTL